jgi:peroxiredoxin
VLVFVEPLDAVTSQDLIAALGEHLADFGRDRVQILAVARTEAADASQVADGIDGNLRVLADPEEQLAHRFGVDYRLDRTTVVLIRDDGTPTTVWSGPPGPGAASSLRMLLWQLDDA